MASPSVAFEIDFASDGTSQSRRAALGVLAQRIGKLRAGISARDVCRYFLARERLGSTALGAGVAAPHAIFEDSCTPLVQVTRLRSPIAFDAADGKPVDLLMCVVGDRHDLGWLYWALPRLEKLANTPEFSSRIRSAKDAAEVQNTLAFVGIHTERTLSQKADET